MKTLRLITPAVCLMGFGAFAAQTFDLAVREETRHLIVDASADPDERTLAWETENARCETSVPCAFTNRLGRLTASPSPDDQAADPLVRPECERANVMASDGVGAWRLSWARVGRSVTRVRAAYALGDRLVAPDGFGEVDWAKTYQASAAIAGQADMFFFSGSSDLSDAAVYFACGGDAVTVVWCRKGSDEQLRQTFRVSETASSRPYRLYRTDAPYYNDPVTFSRYYVKIVGSPNVLGCTYRTSVVTNDGVAVVVTNGVTRGVYLDETGKNLYCSGDVKGQFLLAYYDTADMTRLLDVQVVEACTPSVRLVSAVVGQELKPQADGYESSGLYPEVVTSSRTTYDGRGDFIYVHEGASYSPHRNCAYAIRPTKDESDTLDHTWDATINWYAPDEFGTEWPFEQTQYSIRWGTGVRMLVSGDRLKPGQMPVFPDGWTVALCDYQSPDAHVLDASSSSTADEDSFASTLNWRGAGKSLLMVTGTDADGLTDVAFVQVDAVEAATVPETTTPWPIGRRVVPSIAGAAAVTNAAGVSWLGYIHEPWSSLSFDEEDYVAPSADLVAGYAESDFSGVSVSETGEVSGLDDASVDDSGVTVTVRSDIFFVNAPEASHPNQTDEIWWNAAVTAGGLDGTAYFPSFRERFKPVLPDPDETEQIVLASGKGSSGVSVWGSVWHTNAAIRADSLPHVYAGGTNAVDGTGRGWSPNVTHAWCRAGDGDYVCWAFRCDMKVHSELEHPFVYVKGEGTDADGYPERRVWVYYVLPTNAAYPKFAGDALVGEQLPGPHPFDLCEPAWMPETWWESPDDHSRIVAYRDRKGAVWARRDGDLDIHMYYGNRSDFAYTYLENGVPRSWKVSVPSGASVPWNCELVPNESANTAAAGRWTWHAAWPANVPTMSVAQTLTRAKNNVPEVYGAASAAVVWPEPNGITASGDATENDVAQLVDPTCARTASLNFGIARGYLLRDLGFSSDPGGNCVYRDSLYYFRDLPGSIGRRLYYDPNADISKCLILKGVLDEESTTLTEILYPNVLNETERAAIRALVADDNAYKAQWDAAVNGLAASAVIPNGHRYRSAVSPSGHVYWEFVTDYSAKDHYAIATLGGGDAGTNYVVWIENDADPDAGLGVEEGDAVSMHVFAVKPSYYAAYCVTRTDENNLLSQLLDVVYTDPLGGKPEDFYFQWQSAEPHADGTLPDEDDWRDSGRAGQGLTRFTLGTGGTLMDLVNTYWRVRYRAVAGSAAAEHMGMGWSDFTDPCLAEGWIQRVINSITPFTQRVTDLYENPPETTVSMLRQIGGPYQGDVALNMDNVENCGLLEMYMTLLNKAESMSIAMGTDASIDDTSVNKQLLQLVERLDDFYALLGNEAYSDAANPSIACSDATSSYTSAFSLGSLFAFDNQVSTLLDEELALLRGRGVDGNETLYRQPPCYNRLLWNFTRGITEGEVAYAMNYDIYATGDSIDIDADSAADYYPQGHGDAWGHYLSGLKLWYRLIRNPSFSWSVSMGEMNVDDHVTNVDYSEEEKMAEAAASLGKTAQRVVDLTARKVWRDRGGTSSAASAGYEDEDATRAFGYGEWANRGGVACFANWVVANSLLPAADTNGTAYTDEGLLKINRSTVTALADLASRYDLIQRTADRLNANLNPLGLAENAVPFGLSPAAADGSESHFEQSLASAETALGNANALLEKAGESTAYLRSLAYAEKEAEETAAKEEEDFNNRLVAYYGYPYAGDIGVGKTYAQDYDGPDTVHWMYMDKSATTAAENADTVYTVTYGFGVGSELGVDQELSYNYSRLGLVIKPDSVDGSRRAWGSLQYAYSDYLTAISAYETAYKNYQGLVQSYENNLIVSLVKTLGIGLSQLATGAISSKAEKAEEEQEIDYIVTANNAQTLAMLKTNIRVSSLANYGSNVKDKYTLEVTGRSPGVITGRTTAELEEASQLLFQKAFEEDTISETDEMAKVKASGSAWASDSKKAKKLEKVSGMVSLLSTFYNLAVGVSSQICAYYTQRNTAASSVISAFNAISPAAEKVLTLKSEAEAILNERKTARVARAQKAAKSRYSDMAHRLWRDEALDRYADAFDIAQRYAWLAAKAYDYETGGAITAGGETSEFLDEIIGTRLPGTLQSDGSPMRWGGNGDAGLSDILARLRENYEVVKPRLGINNPQGEVTWFSLRTEAFRILPGADGLNAWCNRLDACRVSSLKNVPAYTRLCSGSSEEPAIVIPLATVIEQGKNFFGFDLAGGESRFSETYFATKIAEAGVELVGYDGSAFSATPYVYLVPAGTDMMRAPATGETIGFTVADQVLPVPNILGSDSLDADFSELYVSLTGQSAGNVKVRKYPAFRARLSEDGSSDAETNASTLIGRSVWNTEWVLIIPGSSLRADADAALKELIWGNGRTTGVTDIKIGFRTYSHWGN